MEGNRIKQIVEAALMAADEPLNVERLVRLFKRGEIPIDDLRQSVRESLEALAVDCEGRGFELRQVASGYRFQVRQELSEWVSRLWEEKPGKYSRAFLETLALIAYRQPVTRGDIEVVRGVAVSPNIIRTLLERGWIRIVGTRDVPGKPSLYGTTKEFLDYFNLAALSELPPLAEIRSLLEHDAPLDESVEGGVSVELIDLDDDLEDAAAEAPEEAPEEVPEETPAVEHLFPADRPAASAEPAESQAVIVDDQGDGDDETVLASNVVRLPIGHG